MAQVQMSVSKAPPVMRLIVNTYGVWLLMPHSIPILQPKESIIVSDVILEDVQDGWIKCW